jgi:hypothetical protein
MIGDDDIYTFCICIGYFLDRGDTIIYGDNECASYFIYLIYMFFLYAVAIFGPMRKSDRDIFVS